MWRHLASNALTFFVVLLFVIGGAVSWGIRQYDAPGPLAQAICLQVPSGGSMGAVADELVARGAISSGTIFRIGVDYAELADDLKAGSFLLREGVSMAEIADTITRGGASTCGSQVQLIVGVSRNSIQLRELDPATERFVELARFEPGVEPEPSELAGMMTGADTQFSVVVVPGTTAWQVQQALNGWEVLEGDVEETPAEGMLAPNSYEVRPGDTVAETLARMQSAQEQVIAEEWSERAPDLPFDTPEEALVLASIIEKETGVAEERAVVSSVLVNRLRTGMRLQFDPTIIYGITRGQGILDRPISNADIDGRTEARLHGEILYNTYQIDGLPAGPIALPGREAIEAALNPGVTDYLFFVALGDGTGRHAFAVTLEDHNANVARLRAAEAAAGD